MDDGWRVRKCFMNTMMIIIIIDNQHLINNIANEDFEHYDHDNIDNSNDNLYFLIYKIPTSSSESQKEDNIE